MSSSMRLAYAACAFAVLGVVAWFSFREDAAVIKPVTAASPMAEPETPPVSAESVPTTRAYPTDSQIPYDKLTTVAKVENRVIYTTSSMGEPMEVHPDGLVVIYNHKKVFRYPDGREETRYITVRARPKSLPLTELPPEAMR